MTRGEKQGEEEDEEREIEIKYSLHIRYRAKLSKPRTADTCLSWSLFIELVDVG